MKGIITPRGERVSLCRKNLQNKHQRCFGGLNELNQVNGDRTENSHITLGQPFHSYVMALNFFPLWKRETEYKYRDGFILFYFINMKESSFVEIKCQLDATEVFIADLIACSTRFGHQYAHHQELKSIIQWLLLVVFRNTTGSKHWIILLSSWWWA